MRDALASACGRCPRRSNADEPLLSSLDPYDTAIPPPKRESDERDHNSPHNTPHKLIHLWHARRCGCALDRPHPVPSIESGAGGREA